MLRRCKPAVRREALARPRVAQEPACPPAGLSHVGTPTWGLGQRLDDTRSTVLSNTRSGRLLGAHVIRVHVHFGRVVLVQLDGG